MAGEDKQTLSEDIHPGIHDSRVVVVTLGNEFRGDDGAGILFGRLLKEHCQYTVIEGGDAPENITGLILRLHPTVIIIADALDFAEKPGEFAFLPAGRLAGPDISTHSSLFLFVDYLKLMTDAIIYVLGFQPEQLDIGKGMSDTVRESVETAVRTVSRSGVYKCLSTLTEV